MRKRLICFAIFALSTSLGANILQPAVPTKEERPFRIIAGASAGIRNFHPGYDLSNFGAGLSFTHNVGNNFEYGVATFFDTKSYSHGLHFEIISLEFETTLRYMPQIAKGLYFGPVFGAGFVHTEWKANNWGDLQFRLGSALSYYGFYIAPAVILKDISMYKKTVSKDKLANKIGIEMPIGFMFNISDFAGFYLEANPLFITSPHKLGIDATLGLSFSF